MNRIIPVFMSILLVLILSVQGKYFMKSLEHKGNQNITIIKNENKPQGPPINLKFEEDLSISRKAWFPTVLFVDEKENIYIHLDKEQLLKKFNPKGIEISSKKIPKGQGPGQFKHFDPCFAPDGRLYVSDSPQRRITIMDPNFEIMNILRMKFLGGVFRMDSKKNMYFLVLKFLPKTRNRQRIILTRCSSLGKPLFDIYEYEWGVHQNKVTGIYHNIVYPPQIKYKLDSHDNVYYAMSDKYEIRIISPEGKIRKKILKKGKSRKVTQKEIDRYKPKSSGPRFVYEMPEYMPYIADLFVFDNDYLLVVTYENDDDELTLAGDLFDKKGIYRARVQVPKYYLWYLLAMPRKSCSIYKNNRFYTIEADRDEENFYIKRYKLVWNK